LLIESSCRAEIDIFKASRTLQPALFEPPFQRPVLAPVPLTVHQHGEALLETELTALWFFLLPGKCIGHAAHAHGV
jgi:hypothetical protein